MPIPVATGEVVQVLVQGTVEEQECQNVWYFRAQAPDPDMLAHLLVDIAACLLPLIPILAPTYRLDRLKAKIVSPAVGLEEEWYPDNDDTVQGASIGDARSSHESMLISLRTTRPGRKGRGRVFLAGVPEVHTVGSLINIESPLWVALLTFTACMLDKFKARDVPVAGNYEWGVMSRSIGGVKPPFAAAGFARIIKATPVKYLATTRSRKIGKGR
ncbi:hypothetical protein [Lactiplantibacillus plantarum]|uniref:hypothetical protein n=1 Tax=Lactiplantibacillus plantarum TaxID=1590 RepID=UPI0024B9B6C1|nr:hypothetical protein [Lactiplantibacillus plantarum]